MRSEVGQSKGVLLDSTFQIDLLRGKSNRYRQLAELRRQKHSLFSSVICYAEVCAGLRVQEQQAAEEFFRELVQISVNLSIAHRAGFLRRDLRQRGITIELPDLLIAATAIENDLTLLTDNRRDFEPTGVTLYPLDQLYGD